MSTAIWILGAVVAAVVTALAVIGVGMRAQFAPVQCLVRRFNRAILNPRQLTSAGTTGAYASVIEHIGRTTGKTYRTPVQAVSIADHVVIPLPYGARTDWARNVLARGSATITIDGTTWPVTAPQVMPLQDAGASFPPKDERLHRWFHLDQCLRLRRTEPYPAETEETEVRHQ